MKTVDLLAIGEPLMEFAEVERGGERLMLPGFGGDTMNVAVAAARQGAEASVFAAVGDDVFGTKFLELWDREGVDRSHVIVKAGQQTGIYFITYGPEGHVFSYARTGSAASQLGPQDVPLDGIAAAKILHVSGISQAISTSACDAAFAAMRAAKEVGTLVSYDTNLRLKLWPLDRARAIIMTSVALADIARPGLEDARHLIGLEDPDQVADYFLSLGPKVVALTLGKDGTLVATPQKRRRIPGIEVEAVDTTGAGDTFSGAFLAEYVRSGDAFGAARYGNIAAALKSRGHGAVAPIPRRAEVLEALAGAEA